MERIRIRGVVHHLVLCVLVECLVPLWVVLIALLVLKVITPILGVLIVRFVLWVLFHLEELRIVLLVQVVNLALKQEPEIAVHVHKDIILIMEAVIVRFVVLGPIQVLIWIIAIVVNRAHIRVSMGLHRVSSVLQIPVLLMEVLVVFLNLPVTSIGGITGRHV